MEKPTKLLVHGDATLDHCEPMVTSGRCPSVLGAALLLALGWGGTLACGGDSPSGGSDELSSSNESESDESGADDDDDDDGSGDDETSDDDDDDDDDDADDDDDDDDADDDDDSDTLIPDDDDDGGDDDDDASSSTSGTGSSGGDDDDDNAKDCAYVLNEIAVYQVVKTSVMKDGAQATKTVDIVANKKALVRAFVKPGGSARATVKARLTLTTGGKATTYDDEKSISAASTDAELDSTLNFRVPAEALAPDTTYVVEIVDAGDDCDGARWPAQGEGELGVRQVGVVKVMLVPVVSSTNGGEPNTSQEMQEAFADEVLAMYPTEKVDIQMHEVHKTEIDIGKGFETWEDVLGELRELKEKDGLASNLHYYGLLAPEGAGGAGGLAGPGWGNKEGGVGTGLGTNPSFHDWIFAHELGHMHSRWHADCGGATGIDEDFPYPEGAIGTWGIDIRDEDLKNPELTGDDKISDLMSYCQPSWISDYQYKGLTETISELTDYAPLPDDTYSTQSFRMLIVSRDGRSRWGRPITRPVSSREVGEPAQVLNERGEVVAETVVYRMRLNDSGGSIIDVPQPQAHWHTIRVRNAAEAAFAAPASSAGMVRVAR